MEKSAPNKMEARLRVTSSPARRADRDQRRPRASTWATPGDLTLDVTVVPRRRTLEALREIVVNLGRDYAGVDITREPIMIRPGQRITSWAA